MALKSCVCNLDVATLPYIYRGTHKVDAVLQLFKNY